VALLHDLEMRRRAPGSAGRKRRKVARAAGGWRGSTLAGYVYESDDVTCNESFVLHLAPADAPDEILIINNLNTL
jgi:hypothetical protein